MASSLERGDQPSMRRAFSLLAFFDLPSSGTACRASGLNQAATRTSQSGSCRVGTLRATAPMRSRSTLAMSSIDMKSPATARKR